MHRNQLFIQTKQAPGVIARGLLETAISVDSDRLIAAVAYATKAGCQVLVEDFEDKVPKWRQMRKDWLISIDYGISEASALEFLANLPNSAVRIPSAVELLANQLRPADKFHPKLFLFARQRPYALGVFSGSSNLTLSGLYFNVEQATASVWIPPLTRAERLGLRQMKDRCIELEEAIQNIPVLDEELLERYEALRNRERVRTEDDSDVVRKLTGPDPVQPLRISVALATATAFWVEVRYVVENRGRGKPGNQIDLQRGSRIFFGFGARQVQRNTALGQVPIRYRGQVVKCNMRFGNNYMDKLNLPIPNTAGPPSYENQILLFVRSPDGVFDLEVGTPKDVARWRERSIEQGTLFRMQSGREFGVFS